MVMSELLVDKRGPWTYEDLQVSIATYSLDPRSRSAPWRRDLVG